MAFVAGQKPRASQLNADLGLTLRAGAKVRASVLRARLGGTYPAAGDRLRAFELNQAAGLTP
jgi:hypothetical protein